MGCDVSCPCVPAGSEANVAYPLLVIVQLCPLLRAILVAVNLVPLSFVSGEFLSGPGAGLVGLWAAIGDFGVLLGCSSSMHPCPGTVRSCLFWVDPAGA